MENFEIFSEPRKIYREMLKDVLNAKKSVILESYIYSNDKIGKKFLRTFIKKAKQGVKIKVLLDGFGSEVKKSFFAELEKYGGEVKFFREFRYVIRVISKNNERNHRKLLIIDDEVTYIGSANITAKCLNWRELILKFRDPTLTKHFVSSFEYSWKTSEVFSDEKIMLKIHKGFEILQDIPKSSKKITEKKYSKLIRGAKKEILIETPYFVPPIHIRKALAYAVKNRVSVKILLPYISDVRIIDIFRNRYLGNLHKNGIKIFFYTEKILHSKLLIVDDKFFLFGSSNLDYRSFTHQREINLFGKDKKIIVELKKFFNSGIKKSKPFNYNEWKKRSSFGKIIELALETINKHL